MDASFTFLPVAPHEYLHWLREAHWSSDNWQRFETALDALSSYTGARTKANRRKATGTGFSADVGMTADASTDSRQQLFIALARQIVAQEELQSAVESCRELCREEPLGTDVERLLAWLQARHNEAEAEVQMAHLLKLHNVTERTDH